MASYGSTPAAPRALHAEVGDLPRLSRPRGFVMAVSTLGAAALLAIGVSGLLSSAPATPAVAAADDDVHASALVASTKNGLDDTQCVGGSYDKRNLLRSVEVSFDTTSPMILHATIDLAFSGEVFQHSKDLLVSIEYHRNASELTPLWSMKQEIDCSRSPGADNSGSVSIWRLSPDATYHFAVWVQAIGEDYASREHVGIFRSPRTGFARFDGQPFLHLGGVTPTYEIATFAAVPGFKIQTKSETGHVKYFEGLIGVDAEGWVVWYYHACAVESWDFLPGGEIVLLSRSDAECTSNPNGKKSWEKDIVNVSDAMSARAEATPESRDTHRWNANSQMQVISLMGRLEEQFVQGCTGHAMNFNKLGAECRVDHTNPMTPWPILTSIYEMENFPNVSVKTRLSRTESKTEQHDTFAGGKIVRWNRDTGKVEPLYSLFDYADPHANMFESASWSTIDPFSCSGNVTRSSVIDYHSVSSVSIGSQSNLLVASRSLDTVWSFAHDGSGLQWTFSSSLDSDYTFMGDADRFYSPADVSQLPNGNILMIDNGANRPGCGAEQTAGCFSRAIMYKLVEADDIAMTPAVAEVVWQYSFPYQLDKTTGPADNPNNGSKVWKHAMTSDAFNTQGGSIRRLANGNYMFAFTSLDSGRLWNPRASSYIFEIDMDSSKVVYSKLTLPTPEYNVGEQNGYRFVPWSAVNGEKETCPFDDSEEDDGDTLRGARTKPPKQKDGGQ